MTLTEDILVSWLKSHCQMTSISVPIGIGDDMAQIALSEKESVLITTDMLLDGVHFDLSTTDIKQVGYKAMAVNLSDCAAMATDPIAAVVSVGLPQGMSEDHLKTLHEGLSQAGQQFGCVLVGGDTTCWRSNAPLVINIAMLSRPYVHCTPVKRSTAQVGDAICVTGTLGGSLSGHHLTFTPRIQEAKALTQSVPIHAMMDLSDGLSTDLPRLCQASQVGAHIDAKQLPLSESALNSPDPIQAALGDGEDFELLFTLAPENLDKLQKSWIIPTLITQIGTILDTQTVTIAYPGQPEQPLVSTGFDHLSRKA